MREEMLRLKGFCWIPKNEWFLSKLQGDLKNIGQIKFFTHFRKSSLGNFNDIKLLINDLNESNYDFKVERCGKINL